MKAEIKGKKLIIEIEMNPEPILSASGKTHVVASSHGNQPTNVEIDGKVLVVGINAYIK